MWIIIWSWDTIKTKAVAKSFKKCRISNILNSTEDEEISEENIESSDIKEVGNMLKEFEIDTNGEFYV